MRNTNWRNLYLGYGRGNFKWTEKTYVMGVINITSDSFSGDGIADLESAVAQGKRFVADGADILDVGGQSTRPVLSAQIEAQLSGDALASTPGELTSEEEIRRVVPVIRRLVKEVDVPISVDTYKPGVAHVALKAGAVIVNDVWGLKKDASLAAVVAEHNAVLILMHNQQGTEYVDLIADIKESLFASIDSALSSGVPGERIILDPGFGFGKTPTQNLEVLRRLGELAEMGYPLLVGSSRKSTIGLVLDLPVHERLEGTAATVAVAISNGANIVRVHDVKVMARVAKMTDAIVGRNCVFRT
jgi:dihydropteroate synthase